MLTEAGLLVREQRGRWAYFRVDASRLGVLRDALDVGVVAATPPIT